MKLLKLAALSSLVLGAQAFAQNQVTQGDGGIATATVEAKVEFVQPLDGNVSSNLNFGVLTTRWDSSMGPITVTGDKARTADSLIEVFSDDKWVTTAKISFYGWADATTAGRENSGNNNDYRSSWVDGVSITTPGSITFYDANGNDVSSAGTLKMFDAAVTCISNCVAGGSDNAAKF